MSAETLRRAASLMRERAEAATPSPWHTTTEGLTHPGWGTEVRSETATVVGDCCGYQGGANLADGEHIASWHPAVALAVADLLDAQATFMEDGGDFSDIEGGGDANALTIARAYLGEDS